ncbi:MAG: autonomous glycyl radical cofactor GrcA, partial [Defluviitaleaceae bacterium]|nr:autonomous glycyl radical cofactor GrcA [Defluviitaleaceae bacterium]
AMGGSQLQINVADRQTLLDAIKNPSAYRSLVVRVGGFSAYFIHLSKEQQQEIISRTESSF